MSSTALLCSLVCILFAGVVLGYALCLSLTAEERKKAQAVLRQSRRNAYERTYRAEQQQR